MTLWFMIIAGCGLVIVSIPLTVIVVIWTGRQQWNHDTWLLLPLGTCMVGVVLLSGAAVAALQTLG